MRLIVILLFALIANAQVITLERKPCYGMCPVYTLHIDASGLVSYHGVQYVFAIGDRSGKIDPAKFQELLQQFQRVGFFQLRDEYSKGPTDMATTFISLTQNGKTKRILDYYGAPPELTELEHSIERAAKVHQWLHDTTSRHTLNSPDAGRGTQEGEDLTNDSIVQRDAYSGRLNPAWTSLMYASVSMQPDEVDRLLKAGAPVDQQDPRGNTALIGTAAVRFSPIEEPVVVKLLIAKGAVVNRANDLGETALMWAARAGNSDVLTILLNSGADPANIDKAGHNALFYLTLARRNILRDPELVKCYDRAAAVLQNLRDAAH